MAVAVTTKETLNMPGVKGIGNETMGVYGQFAMALAAEMSANNLEDEILGRRLTESEVAQLLASNGVISVNGADRDLSEVRALHIKAEGHLEKAAAADVA